jgi:antitoxin component of MazEF toxin-antitoxin module
MTTQTISKWGSSLAFRLPAAFAIQMQLVEGSKVELVLDGERLMIQPATEATDAAMFFKAVKESQVERGLVAVGRARG